MWTQFKLMQSTHRWKIETMRERVKGIHATLHSGLADVEKVKVNITLCKTK